MSSARPQAVLFDLDDTLYDHLYSARHGLIALRRRYRAMQCVPVSELEQRYSHALEAIHVRLLRGEVTQTEARTRRMQQVFRSFGIDVTDEVAFAQYRQFRQDYDDVCQCVRGAEALLQRLQAAELRLAVVTNNLVSEQIPKLKQLGFDTLFDVVSISEEVGVSKPDRQIFDVTLERLGLSCEDVVMVGDSLASDIAGAQALGIRSVWINRQPEKGLIAPAGVSVIERDFADLDASLACILG